MFKKFCSFGAAAVASLGSAVVALAQEGGAGGGAGVVNPPTIVTTNDIQGTIVTAIQPWITAGLGIGIAVFCIYLGWRLIRRFTR